MSHQVVHQTARRDLLDLADRGLLTKQKLGRQVVFHPGSGLERRLRSLAKDERRKSD